MLGIGAFDKFLGPDLARNVLNLSIQGRLDASALALTDDELVAFIISVVEEIRNQIDDTRVEENMLEANLVSALVRWMPLHLDYPEEITEVELRNILFLPRKHYPGYVRPQGGKKQVFTIAGQVKY